jgi:hypothetical protein
MKIFRLTPNECIYLLPFGIVALIASQTIIKNISVGSGRDYGGLLFIFGMMATLFGLLGLTHLISRRKTLRPKNDISIVTSNQDFTPYKPYDD